MGRGNSIGYSWKPLSAIAWRGMMSWLAVTACCGQARFSQAQSPFADFVIETTREINPQTAPELVSAVNNLLNAGANEAAREYFLKLAQQDLSEEQLAALYHELGAATFVQFGREAALAPEGSEFAQRVVSAAKAWAENPAQLRSQLALIAGPSEPQRLLALHRFAEGREQAAVLLLQQLSDPQCPYDKPKLRTAWPYIGRPAAGPALAAMYAKDGPLQLEALQALVTVRPAEAIPHLAAVALSRQDELLRRMALQALGQSTAPTSESDLLERVEQAVISRMRTTRSPNYETQRLVWSWDEPAQEVRMIKLPWRTAQFVEANRLCHKLASDDPRYGAWYLATEMGLHHQFARDGDLRSQWESFARRYGSPLTAAMISQSLAWCLQYDVPEAATTACEFLSVVLQAESATSGDQWTAIEALSDALRSPYVEVREHAALALMRANPRVPFAGAADLLHAALQLATTRGQRRALVVHPVAVEANQLANLLINAGWLADTANSGKKALRPLLHSGDFELILLSTQLFRPRYSELLQQLQGDFRTQGIPTVILMTDANSRELDALELRWPGLQAFPFPVDEQGLDEILRRVGVSGERKSTSTRILQAKLALRWLAQVAENPGQRSFYELAAYDRELVSTLDQPELLVEAAEVLGKLGTRPARQALRAALNLATEGSPEREILEESLSAAMSP